MVNTILLEVTVYINIVMNCIIREIILDVKYKGVKLEYLKR